jgi:hypothetical protein
MIIVQAPATVTVKPPPPPRWAIVEAPADLAELFGRWLRSSRCTRLTAELTQALYAHRGTRFLTVSHLFYLAKISDRHDEEIISMDRSLPLNHERMSGAVRPEA